MSNYKTEELQLFTQAFKALANPHRLEIFNILSHCCDYDPGKGDQEVPTCCVGDLGPRLDVAPSTLSHHLKELQRAGLVNMHRKGKHIYCSLNIGMIKELRMLLKYYEQNKRHAEKFLNQRD